MTHIRPPEPEQDRATRRVRDVRVDPAAFPGWVRGTERLPEPGERVYTNEGPAVVVRLLGRTGASGRLLELSMADGRKSAFFAAAANIMVRPTIDPDVAGPEVAPS